MHLKQSRNQCLPFCIDNFIRLGFNSFASCRNHRPYASVFYIHIAVFFIKSFCQRADQSAVFYDFHIYLRFVFFILL